MTEKELNEKMGKRLKEIRQKTKLSQQNFSKILDIRQRVFSYYEKGERAIPYTVVVALTKIYNISPTWFITGKGKKTIKDVDD